MTNMISVEHPDFGLHWVIVINPKAKELYFSASHVACALGYMNPQKAVNEYCKDKCHYRDASLVGAVISEADVVRLINHSPASHAEAYRRWLVDDVIPYVHSMIHRDMAQQNHKP